MHAEDSQRIRLLALGAHPDDIEAGCGGTLIKYARNGHQIFLMVMTEGERGAKAGIRKREQQKAAKSLCAEKIYWGGYPDAELPMDQGLIQQIEQVVREVAPHFIFVHFHDDTHQDHRNLALSTVTATRYTKNVLFYEGPTTQNFSPTVFVDIDSVLEDKIDALRAHASQVKKTNIEGLSIVDIIRSSAHFRGIQGRVKNAEGFVPLRLFINIKP
ncbi:MAG: PIG-L family deacetylase [Nitrospirae bacterium]|nr:PIG-L family deacetylase [Nitrospirota bacterium]